MKKINCLSAFILVLAMAFPLYAAENAPASPIKKTKATLYTDLVDQTVHYEFTSYLRMDRIYRKLFNKKLHAEDINVYDQLPDSSFYENRHAKTAFSTEALAKGPAENDGPAKGKLTVSKGKSEGLNPGFFVKDSRGDKYLFKFDPISNPELLTSTESIISRFYYAIGYHVPQYTVFTFDPLDLVPADNATMVDRTGFKKKLTPELLQQFLILVPRDADGNIRASASKILKGEPKGAFSFQGRRKDDPEDTIAHEKRRAIRALRVFGSWLNNNDVRRQNSLDMWVTENGRSYLKHYLIDFNSSLGAAANGPKPPQFTHEYFVDYGEVTKNMAWLGFRESGWQKRWKENGEEINSPAAQGYFDNKYFYPEKYKVQLPYYAFKDMTRADGYWAAKIIMAFKDEDIRAIIKTGKLSEAADEENIFTLLKERRDAIGRYWFSQASPAENFKLGGGKFSFSDLEAERGFQESSSGWTLEGFAAEEKKGRKLGKLESSTPSFGIPDEWLKSRNLTLLLRVHRASEKKPRPCVFLEIKDGKMTKALHQD